MVIRYGDAPSNASLPRLPMLFTGRIVHSKSLQHLEILPNGVLGVLANGTIRFLYSRYGSISELRERYAEEGFATAPVTILKSSQFLFPGMIDTHLHAPQWPNLALGMDAKLKNWTEEWTNPVEASFSDNDKARRVYKDVVRTTLKLGSTTVAYNATIHADATNILADAALEAGQRAIVGKMCITRGGTAGNCEDSTEVSVAGSGKSIKYIEEMDPDRNFISPCVMPRGGPYCPPDLMEEIERMKEIHPAFETYSDMYKHYHLLHRKSILAHCVHLTPTDFRNLKECNAGVAHNPNSNTCLRDGECRVRDLLDHGIKVGLGTDCSAGYMPSIPDAMRNASNVSRHLAMRTGEERHVLGFNELVYLATMGGARVVDLQDRIGNFERGKMFDALVIDTEGIISAELGIEEHGQQDPAVLVKKWVFLGDDRHIAKVFVDGKLVAGNDVK